MRIRRGELEGLEAAQERWRLRGLPEQFGLPVTALTTILLAEAHGRHGDVTDLARESWTTALDGGRLLWALLAGPDIARLALDAGDSGPAASRWRRTRPQCRSRKPWAWPPRSTSWRRWPTPTPPGSCRRRAAAYANRGHAAGALGAWEKSAVAAAGLRRR